MNHLLQRTKKNQTRGCDPWEITLRAAGSTYLAQLEPLVSAADPQGNVTARSRHLCAALGMLSVAAYQSLGGRNHADDVGLAGAALSLLTKVDDEVIDRPSFHGGMTTDRSVLRARTTAYLAPTLASIKQGVAATDEPRCMLAADVGQRLRRLAHDPARLDHVLDVISHGWDVQVDAVAVLSSHPGQVNFVDVARVTQNISGAWLLMIALIGMLPGDAKRQFSSDEEAAFYNWGYHIQRADALADLEKDCNDGLISSFAGYLAWQHEPARYIEACAKHDTSTLVEMLDRHGIDHACLAGGVAMPVLQERLANLGTVHSLLAWIHRFLANRYFERPDKVSGARLEVLGGNQLPSLLHSIIGVTPKITLSVGPKPNRVGGKR